MIIKNPLWKSAWIVYTYWYIFLYVTMSWMRKTFPFWVVWDYPLSLVIIFIGIAMGLLASVGTSAWSMHQREQAAKRGESKNGLTVSLGGLPPIPEPKRAQLSPEIQAMLENAFWWPRIQREFPVHARAIKSVLTVMAAEPRLPASPVPGGHGGRTLIEHSFGVAEFILRQSASWKYTGQRDKKGSIRQPLMDKSVPFHRFMAADLGLIALTGLAHDIGKLACYKPRESEITPGTRTVPVDEVLPNHDLEGAVLLRSIPEIQELPYKDRTALLTAVAFYHHPMGMPRSESVDDRMRSLTELLIQADIATGMSEGHVLDAQHEAANNEGGDDLENHQTSSTYVNSDDEDDVADQTTTSQSTIATESNKPLELRIFLRMLEDTNAIGNSARDKQRRIGWRYGDWLYLTDALVRGRIASDPEVTDPIYVATEAQSMTGNASPFTTKLLEQLAERNLLMTTFNGHELKPSRALFITKSAANDRETKGVFLVRANVLNSTSRLPNDKEITLIRPLWGDQSLRKKSAASAVESTSSAEVGDESDDENSAYEMTSTSSDVPEEQNYATEQDEPSAYQESPPLDGYSPPPGPSTAKLDDNQDVYDPLEELSNAIINNGMQFHGLSVTRKSIKGMPYLMIPDDVDAKISIKSVIDGLAEAEYDVRSVINYADNAGNNYCLVPIKSD